jgi:hypothetical protein
MPDDINSKELSEAATAPTLAQRKARIVLSWVRFAKTICRGHAAFVLDTAGGRVRVTFIDGQGDVMKAAHEMVGALTEGEDFVLLDSTAADKSKRGHEGAIVGLRISSSKSLCILVPASRLERLNERRIATLSSVAKLCGSVLAFGATRANGHDPRARRYGPTARFGPQSSGKLYSPKGSRSPAL